MNEIEGKKTKQKDCLKKQKVVTLRVRYMKERRRERERERERREFF